MKHEFLVMVATLIIFTLLIIFLENYLGETWLMALVFIVIFLLFRMALYLYRKSKGIKDPMDTEKWWWL
jgi:uncharacterized membrane protein YccC